MNNGGVAGDHLRSFIERIERLEEERKAFTEDIREIYSEAKSTGFDTKILRKVISLRKLASHEREEQDALLDVYMHALEGGAPVHTMTAVANGVTYEAFIEAGWTDELLIANGYMTA